MIKWSAKTSLALKCLIIPLLVATILSWVIVFTLPDKRLHVSYLDVGQGDAILIQTPVGHNILIDGGPSPQALCTELGKKLPFWDRTIDLMISTQPQADHITGLVEVLKRYKVEQVLYSGSIYDSIIYQKWMTTIGDKQIKHSIARAGQKIKLDSDILIEVFNPPMELFEQTSSDVDNNGIVLKLSWRHISFLFTADIRYEAERRMIMQRFDLSSTVLKVAHHGSKTSTSPRFLSLTDPDIAVISVGADNSFGHPSSEVLKRLFDSLGQENIYQTDIDGTVEFYTDGERLWINE